MTRIGVFFGSSNGATEYVAYEIVQRLNAITPDFAEALNIAHARPEDLLEWEYLILGIPTWDIGQLQVDWDFFLPGLDALDLTGKKVALFGLGDQYGYPDTYLDAVGILAERVVERGAQLVGRWPAAGYQVEASLALEDGYFKGLALDEDNEATLTAGRIATWIAQVVEEFGLRATEAAE